MTLARTPYARLSPADIGQVDRELKKLEQMSNGLFVPKVLVAARSPYTVQATDTMLLCDCTAGAITLTFPLAARVEGMTVVVVKSDTSANAVTLTGTFSGVVNPTITVAHAGFTVVAMNGVYHVAALVTYPLLTGEVGVVNMEKSYNDVRRFGVVGGVDETTKIQNAITSCTTLGYRTLRFWSASYKATGLQINQRDVVFLGCGISETSLSLLDGGTTLIQLDVDDGQPWTNGSYNGAGQGFTARNMRLDYVGTTNAALANGFGNYKTNTYGIRDWRGGGIVLDDTCYITGFHYGFWGIQSDLNNWRNWIFGKNKVGAYLGPRSDQFTSVGGTSFQNDTMFQIEGSGGGRVYGWSTDTDGSTSTYPVVIKNFNDGAGHIRAAGKWLFDGPWLENFGTTASTQAVDAWFDIGRGDTQMNDDVTIRDPNILTNFYSTGTVGRVLYLARVDQIRSLSVERPSGLSGAFSTNLRCLVKVENGGASTSVPFIRCSDGDGSSFRFIENYSTTQVTTVMEGWSALTYSINNLGGTGSVVLTVLSDKPNMPSATFTDHAFFGTGAEPGGGSLANLRVNPTANGGHVLDAQYDLGARVVAACNLTESLTGSASDHPHYLMVKNIYRWKISNLSDTISYLMSVQANTRIVPGSNGLQVRNVADTNDNLKVDDNGNVGVRNSIGYLAGVGVGGTVTQATSKATGVTLNKACGEITMNAAALAAGAIVSFVLTDSVIKNPDALILNHVSGGTLGAYSLNARVTADGSGTIDVLNNTAGSLSEAIVIRFAIVRAQNA